MIFNSLEFALFLPIVFLLYWFCSQKNLRLQNLLLVAASYLFYGWWDWRFLFLLFFSSLVDYAIGRGLKRSKHSEKRRLLLSLSLVVNFGLLAFFKYSNFFIESFYDSFTLLGRPVGDPLILNIILPVGISFYTFQTVSYSIDVYRKRLTPTKDLFAFLAFVSFFPQLVAGPIERATNLLPQFYQKRIFSYENAVDGMRQILWGLFKKVVIADNCAIYANDIFASHSSYSGSTLLLGALFFAFQIYGDFSGYSDIAIGVSRIFGFQLKRNFAFPYFSRDVAEFWRRWHISLSTWFRDYLYIPLGGSRVSTALKIRNTLIIFLVSGLWHGANWTFLVWGFLHACYFLPLLLFAKNRVHTTTVASGRFLPSFKEVVEMVSTFLLIMVAWIFFRSESVGDGFSYISALFSPTLFVMPEVFPKKIVLLLGLFVSIEWFQREKDHVLQIEGAKIFRWGVYYSILFLLFLLGAPQQEFIYFQF